MTQLEAAWMSDPTVQDLMLHFPVALALFAADGDVEFLNQQFLQHFDPACLDSDEVRELLKEPTESWRAQRLARRDGSLAEAQARTLRVHDSTLLVIEETTGAGPNDRMDRLRARIEELELQGSTDRLTGAWNRTHLDRIVEPELGRSERLHQPVSLVLMDIDHFKRVNDTFGHPQGDSVLCGLVRLATAQLRPGDLLFRWGGEEFVVLVSATGYRGAAAVAERLRSAVEAHPFGTVGRVTISLGVAEHLGGEDRARWFERVDAALYASKHDGRNRVSVDEQGASDAWAEAGGAAPVQLQWLESYACGEPTIDREHQQLFELANATLAALLAANSDPGRFLDALNALLAHVTKHFADEEALLEKHGYENLEGHKRAHHALLARAAELQARAKAGMITFGHLVEFLGVDVVVNHLVKCDRQFYPLFRRGHAIEQSEAGR